MLVQMAYVMSVGLHRDEQSTFTSTLQLLSAQPGSSVFFLAQVYPDLTCALCFHSPPWLESRRALSGVTS